MSESVEDRVCDRDSRLKYDSAGLSRLIMSQPLSWYQNVSTGNSGTKIAKQVISLIYSKQRCVQCFRDHLNSNLVQT